MTCTRKDTHTHTKKWRVIIYRITEALIELGAKWARRSVWDGGEKRRRRRVWQSRPPGALFVSACGAVPLITQHSTLTHTSVCVVYPSCCASWLIAIKDSSQSHRGGLGNNADTAPSLQYWGEGGHQLSVVHGMADECWQLQTTTMKRDVRLSFLCASGQRTLSLIEAPDRCRCATLSPRRRRRQHFGFYFYSSLLCGGGGDRVCAIKAKGFWRLTSPLRSGAVVL